MFYVLSSDRVQTYLSEIILYFQLQNHIFILMSPLSGALGNHHQVQA